MTVQNRWPKTWMFTWLVGLTGLVAGIAPPPAPAQDVRPDEGLRHAESLSAAFEQVAETLRPSVVSISSTRRIQPTTEIGPGANPFQDSPMRDFFGDDFLERFFRQRIPREGFLQRGLGSGVIVRDDGVILTNNHVVGNADKVTVKLYDGRTLDAEVIGSDAMTDLAVIRVKAGGLQPARLGDSGRLRVGEWVVAIGNPFGLDYTITAGIVSAKGRANVGIADYEDFIQTDAAINPGNSGGPLVNLRGEVVGINSAIATRSGGFMGVGFAIPTDMARTIMESLIEKGRVVRGWLGVAIQPLNEGLARSFGFEGTEGVLIGDVNPGGPAEKAGFKPGDILTELDGRRVTDVNQLRNLVAGIPPGTSVEARIFREGERKRIDIKVGELETATAARPAQSTETELGIRVQNLTPELAKQFGYDQQEGVVVSQVDQTGLAAGAGLAVGDLILSVQGRPVSDVNEFREAMGRHDLARGVRLVVRSGQTQRFVFLQSQ